ncbi:MAG: hypothetical protein HS115_15680 [Spirochaetales bacterium]|nr:hypothetical protein [Spirochaetales bacterium]
MPGRFTGRFNLLFLAALGLSGGCASSDQLRAGRTAITVPGLFPGQRISYSEFLEEPAASGNAEFLHRGPVNVYPLFYAPLKSARGSEYLLSLHNAGLFKGRGKRWQRLPVEKRYTPSDYSGPVLYRDTLAFWQNPLRPEHLLIVLKHSLLESHDGGENFRRRSVRTRNNDLFTAVTARTSEDGELLEIYLGTAHNGILRQTTTGRQDRIQAGIPGRMHDSSITFYEEIVDLRNINNEIHFRTLIQPHECRLEEKRASCQPLDHSKPAGAGIGQVTYKEPSARSKRSVRGFYIAASSVRRPQIDALIASRAFNAAVIDFKDDHGRLIAGSQIPEARSMQNEMERAPLATLLQKLKNQDIHTIARIVVFKDSRALSYQKGQHAVKSKAGGIWQGKTEEDRWIDPFSEWAQTYNLKVAMEAESLGFDEIQFDYIRFPSDGPIGLCRFTHMPGDAYKSEALEAFLRRARSFIKVPISADLFGYNAIYRAGGVIGQDFLDIGEFVDIISPMHYPSHFGTAFMRETPRDERAFELLRTGCSYASKRAEGRFLLRPWLQAFDMFSNVWGYGPAYFQGQAKGAREGGCQGDLWWGSLDDMRRVAESF